MTLVEMAARYGLKSADGLRRQAIRGTLKATKIGTGRHAVWVVREEDAERYASDHLGKPGFAAETHPFHGQRPPRKGEQPLFFGPSVGICIPTPTDEATDDPTPPSAVKRRDDTQ